MTKKQAKQNIDFLKCHIVSTSIGIRGANVGGSKIKSYELVQ